MICLPFHPNHLLQITCVPEEDFIAESMKDPKVRRQYYAPGLAYTCVEEDKVLSCWGLAPITHGRAIAWAVFDRDVGPVRFLKTARLAKIRMDDLLGPYFFRYEAYIQTDYPQAARYAEYCGFEKEGIMRKLDGKRDFILYSRIAND